MRVHSPKGTERCNTVKTTGLSYHSEPNGLFLPSSPPNPHLSCSLAQSQGSLSTTNWTGWSEACSARSARWEEAQTMAPCSLFSGPEPVSQAIAVPAYPQHSQGTRHRARQDQAPPGTPASLTLSQGIEPSRSACSSSFSPS